MRVEDYARLKNNDIDTIKKIYDRDGVKWITLDFINKLYAIIKQALLQAVEDKKKVERYFELQSNSRGDEQNGEYEKLVKELTSDEG